jgi:hypothetical protein
MASGLPLGFFAFGAGTILLLGAPGARSSALGIFLLTLATLMLVLFAASRRSGGTVRASSAVRRGAGSAARRDPGSHQVSVVAPSLTAAVAAILGEFSKFSGLSGRVARP